MNKPYRLPSRTRTENKTRSNPSSAKSNEGNDSYYRRRGLSTAEEIVTLILRRYGIDEEAVEENSEFNMQAKEEAAVLETVESSASQTKKEAPLPVTVSSPSLPAQQLTLWG